MPSRVLQPATFVFIAAAITAAGRTDATGGLSFTKDVRPILSKNCFACHGPDEEERKGDLRLDVPGDIDFDEIIARITTDDPDDRMPPPEANKTLAAAEVATIRQWIDEGAAYERHWAFVPPSAPPVPENAHAIDHFIDRALAGAGLGRAPQADPYTRIRRVSLDLIGLPPTPDEADAFAADPSDEAYAAIVDRLLASPRYGERWARRWLDLARYADTNGYEKDRDRSIWPYRDWVIRALNEGLPFDQFTVEQIAGDMLPGATPDQIVATGFHRNTMLNEEGGVDPLEFRYHAMADRVATTGTTWLGLTTGCAQCHTHKYDPITHRDYFGMMAYLNNTEEPDYELPAPGAGARYERDLAQADHLLEGLAQEWPADAPPLAEALAAWIGRERSNVAIWHPLVATRLAANVPYLIQEADGVVFAGGDTSKHDIYTLEFPARDQPITSLRIEALPDPRLPDNGPGMTYYEGRKGDFYLTELAIVPGGGDAVRFAGASETYAKNGFSSQIASAAMAIDGDIQTGWSVADASGRSHSAVFNLAAPIPAGTPFSIRMDFGRHYASSLGKFRLSATASEGPVGATSLSPEVLAALAAPDAESSPKVRQAFLLQAPELAEQSEAIRKLREPDTGTTTLVMRERPPGRTRPTYLRHRGEYTQPKEEVQPRLPDAIWPPDQSPPSDRLAFARWLVSRDNPLSARVVANRQWSAFFGTGIVKTLDDFGMQGELPSHPRLLDFLAIYLMDEGWSIKALHRLIVTSQTYQQQSTSAPGDPRLLGTFPRVRLEAEIIRDAALAASGLLATEMFGPPVRPPQPEAARAANYSKSEWTASTGRDRYRRSVYTYQKRTAPFAMFTTFDATSGEACVARRDVSNTPLQALTLMNDPMFIEIAEAYGKRISEIEGGTPTKVSTAFRLLLTRPPSPDELDLLTAFHEKHQSYSALARALLSLDEAITKG